MAPAVLTGVTREMDAFKEAIFGPVAVVYSYDGVDEARATDDGPNLSYSIWRFHRRVLDLVMRRVPVIDDAVCSFVGGLGR